MNTWKIREIKPEDNQQVKELVRSVLVEMGVPKVGTAYEDKALDDMTRTYEGEKKVYYVVEENSKIIGSAGIAPLTGEEETICELQKMYFLPEARGRGIGMKMINQCMDFGREQGFKKCYIETLPYMENARKLYHKNNFEVIEKPLGNTGHYNCTVFMVRDL
ncbi:GNAT family N-acetyltransferase [Christiangramia forsetii]|uniref:GNAT family acetyltransferase n=2 Tax=Christiangramia forsetii TaxID=411153 RepID=A0LZ19_CHRFK|nr:GNAT family N-acetyltransferase [Christiangramia forsetii]GGG37198.1 N-acetyltransferase [Christiangramia forsetii]CAL65614.1 GNAT family acetyltransferase [Christiangramia forsetii KT0803]